MATTIWSRNKLYVDVSINEDGTLVFAGQDLNPPSTYGDEYEYWITVTAADFPVVVAALGGAPGDDVIPLVAAHAEMIVRSGERAWLAGLGLTTKFGRYFCCPTAGGASSLLCSCGDHGSGSRARNRIVETSSLHSCRAIPLGSAHDH